MADDKIDFDELIEAYKTTIGDPADPDFANTINTQAAMLLAAHETDVEEFEAMVEAEYEKWSLLRSMLRNYKRSQGIEVEEDLEEKMAGRTVILV